MSEEKKEQEHGIEESLDMVRYAGAVVKQLTEHKADDGKIDWGEVIQTAVSTMPEGAAAVLGSWNIPAELSDLDAEEKDRLLAEGLPVLMALAKLFLPVNTGEK